MLSKHSQVRSTVSLSASLHSKTFSSAAPDTASGQTPTPAPNMTFPPRRTADGTASDSAPAGCRHAAARPMAARIVTLVARDGAFLPPAQPCGGRYPLAAGVLAAAWRG